MPGTGRRVTPVWRRPRDHGRRRFARLAWGLPVAAFGIPADVRGLQVPAGTGFPAESATTGASESPDLGRAVGGSDCQSPATPATAAYVVTGPIHAMPTPVFEAAIRRVLGTFDSPLDTWEWTWNEDPRPGGTGNLSDHWRFTERRRNDG